MAPVTIGVERDPATSTESLVVDLRCGHSARVQVPALGTDSATREAVALIADVERQDRRGEWPCTACVPLAVAA